MDKIRLVVLFGGRSAEHEVSCTSALHVLRAADPDRFDVVPIGVTREGRWVEAGDAVAALGAGASALPSPDDSDGAELDPLPAIVPSVPAGQAPVPVVVLPLMHGPMGEDGTVQGLFELAGVPYVGAGVLGSALCMDKSAAKRMLSAHGLPQPRWLTAAAGGFDSGFAEQVVAKLGAPVFVKPANLGSSVGVTKASSAAEISAAIDEALRYDDHVVIEEAIVGREIEVAVLGNREPRASIPGEIVPGHEFYDFDDKYVDGLADLRIPAPMTDEARRTVQELAITAYQALYVDGMARVDFFYETEGLARGFLVNELNTIPGFTPISMYPKLWEASGLPYSELIDELVRLALERHDRRKGFETKR
ncbi:MAG TPA: D-alanine--D-alanine ligase family protein [Acidimicrobiales bacterium]|nr:D-alanine--D-alanine ligase family protein [Acidimicrobiales bacterium]